MAGRFQVSCTVPVEVVVDVDEGTVARVVVIDESIAADTEDGTPIVTREGYTPLEDDDDWRVVFKIAESVEWPAWEFGW